jgi:hypothetical protein
MSEEPTLQKEANRGEIDSLSTLAPASMAPAPQDAAGDAERRLLVFRKIAAPLMAAATGSAPDGAGPATPNQNAAQFAELIDATIVLNQEISGMLGLGKADSLARWQAVGAATEIVAAHYRATNHTLTAEEGSAIVATLREAVTPGIDAPDADPVETESDLARNLRALAPVISAIARFSFARDPMELLAEVVGRLTQIAVDVATKLGDTSGSIGSPLYFAVLDVASEFYMESHLTEMNHLLEMAPDERKDYVHSHGRKIPMEPVWERIGLKMGMLEALTSYLPEPPR